MFKEEKADFTAKNGRKRSFRYREGTNDFNTINACFSEDEYRTREMGSFDGSVCVDVGAHVGSFALLCSVLGEGVGVYAYEPIPENHALLFHNAQDNDLQGCVYVHKLAVTGLDAGKVTMRYSAPHAENNHHKFIGAPVLDEADFEKVQTFDAESISLANIFLLNGISKVKVLKVDTEGAEYDIFENTPQELFEMCEFIVGEFHSHPLVEDGTGRARLLAAVGDKFEDLSVGDPKANIGEFFFKRKNG
ncbi:MAG: FkbM family methyltransferase [Patescibacteria group bacterium]